MNAEFPTRCFLAVEAESDPTVAARILHLLTVRGETPEWFSVRKHRRDALRIAVEFAGLDEAKAQFFAHKIRAIPAVLEVSRSWLARRDAVTP